MFPFSPGNGALNWQPSAKGLLKAQNKPQNEPQRADERPAHPDVSPQRPAVTLLAAVCADACQPGACPLQRCSERAARACRASRALMNGTFRTQLLPCPGCLCEGDTFVPINRRRRKPEHIFTPRWLEELFSPALHHCAASVSLTHQHLTGS